MMNKEEIVSQYQALYSELYTTLDKLKELMDKQEFEDLVFNSDGDEDVEMMYGTFNSLVEGIADCYE
jgi:hypothetical protein